MNPDVVAACVDWINARNYVSFTELDSWAEAHGIEPRGDLEITLLPNVLLWAGMSETMCDLVEAIRPHTELHAVSALVYFFDGGALNLPIAKRPPKHGYKTPHWAPVTLCKKGSPL